MRTPKLGFTLVEMSIVMVIIGLLIGAILGGQEMLRQSELRSVLSDVNQYRAIVNSFRTKYVGLPGDMTNATRFWGIAAGDGGQNATCAGGAVSGTLTCNGNGNGRLEDTADNWFVTQENFRFWQHLSNAGLMPTSYSGKGGPAAYYTVELGVNAPSSKIAGAGYMPEGPCNSSAGGCDSSNWDYGTVLHFGALGGDYTEGAVLTPGEAYQLDLKMDDGGPGRGKIRAKFSTNAACHNMTTVANADAAVYNTASSNIACGLNFLRIF